MAVNELYAAIEIGQTLTKLVVGHYFNHQLHVVGRFSVPTKGLTNQRFQDRPQVVATLQSLVAQATQEKLQFSEAVLVIPPTDLTILRRRSNYMIPSIDRIITSNDIDSIMKLVGKAEIPAGMLPIEVAPIEFVLDGNRRTRDNPVGVYASSVQIDAIVSIIPKEFAYAIRNVVEEAGIPLSLITLAPYASFYSTCTTQELDEGIILIDMGGQTTSFTAMKEMQVVAHQSIKIGGHHITLDLGEAFKLDYPKAEALKIYSGNSIANLTSDIPVTLPNLELGTVIKESEVANVIEARIEDIIEELNIFIKNLPIRDALPIVITGGSSDIPNISEKFSQSLKRNCRVASPDNIGVRKGIYSGAVGALIYYMQSALKSDDAVYANNR